MSAPRPRDLEATLARLGFTGTGTAADRLTALGLAATATPSATPTATAPGRRAGPGAGRAGAGGPGSPALLTGLAEAADPDLALAGLERLAAAAPDREALLAGLRTDPALRSRLFAVLGASAGLAEHLAGNPALWHELADAALTTSRPTAAALRATLLRAVGADPTAPPPGSPGGTRARDATAATLDALRLAYRSAQLRLAARDLTGALAVEDVAGELADLAAAAVEASLAVALAGLPDGLPGFRLAVIGMGKCGARELNYVSDVDVILVAEPAAGADEHAALAAATALATGLVRACTEATAAGVLFPLDLGLRPEGRNGPLVRTLASHLAYYDRWARTWEFQALLKARPLAGDRELGAAYIDAVGPRVWAASSRPGFVEEIRQMRRRVESSIPAAQAARELKLGRGGLRDVEFAVQLLQLVHGRADPALRERATLPALTALRDGGYVGRADADALGDAYRWLRRAEHLLQLQRLTRTHTVPAGTPAAERDRRWLARALGYRASGAGDALAAFDAEHARRVRETRRLHEKLLYRPLLSAVARLPDDEAALARLSPAEAATRLSALGFADPVAALRHLEALTAGLSRRAAIQRALLPVLIDTFADAADPDAGLLAFRQVSDALGDTPWYLRRLRDEGEAAAQLARLLAGSRFVAELMVRAPAGVALLGDDAALVPRSREHLEEALLAVVGRSRDWESAVAAARGLRRVELLRIACGELLGRLESGASGPALSDAAAATVSAALFTAWRKVEAERGAPLPLRLSVIAMGRLGGGELGYGSDADVLFVHDPAGMAEAAAAQAAATIAEETRRLLALPAPDPPLLLDTGLRPEGRAGALSRTLVGYAGYYARWAATWEAQALLRAAPCAGDPDLAARFLAEVVDPVRYPQNFPETAADEVRRLKARMEAERVPRFSDRTLHLKLGPGGLSDVEWTVQLLQLRSAATIAALRTPSTLPALAAAADAGLLAGADARLLRTAWLAATRLRNAVTLVTGRPADVLPREGRVLAGVAAMLGHAPGPPGAAAVLAEHRELAGAAREVVTRVFGRTS